MDQFKLLFSPKRIKHIEVKNRIAVTAHATGLNPNSYPSDEFIEYNVAKARGGAGLLFTMGSGSVHPTSPNSDWGGIHNWDDSVIPYFQKMSEMIKPYGSVLIGQISHRGRRASSDVTWQPVFAPSDIPEPVHRSMPHIIQPDEVDWLVDCYAKAALRLKKGGFDGVEISAAHGHLIDQFWSPISNRRTDEYGGSLENRMRFGMKVIEAVRDAVGDDFIVAMRITGDELIEGGLTTEDMQEIALRTVATGKIDLLSVIGSVSATDMNQALTVASMYYPPGIFVGFAGAIRSYLQESGYDIPVLGAGRILHPQQGETILDEGQADFIGMNRAVIADPDLPIKTMEGRLSDIRLCMGANEGCIGRIEVGKPITCVQNPVIGRESELLTWAPAAKRKNVLVVGGGPAGLEAGRMAAERGHHVTILEKNPQLGGLIRLAAKAPYREAYASSVDWLEGQVKKLGITVKTGYEATVESILDHGADVVIIATGSTPRRLEIPGSDLPFVVTAREVLSETVEVGNRVLFIDDHHHQEGLSTVEFLAERGHEVTVISNNWVIGGSIDGTLRPDLYARLDNLGVILHTVTNAKEIYENKSVLVEQYHSHREWEIGEFDTVVVAARGVANDGLWRELKGKVNDLYCIGDAIASRGLHDALLEGTRIARQI